MNTTFDPNQQLAHLVGQFVQASQACDEAAEVAKKDVILHINRIVHRHPAEMEMQRLLNLPLPCPVPTKALDDVMDHEELEEIRFDLDDQVRHEWVQRWERAVQVTACFPHLHPVVGQLIADGYAHMESVDVGQWATLFTEWACRTGNLDLCRWAVDSAGSTGIVKLDCMKHALESPLPQARQVALTMARLFLGEGGWTHVDWWHNMLSLVHSKPTYRWMVPPLQALLVQFNLGVLNHLSLSRA